LAAQDLAKVESLVRGAIGYDESRGDQVRVVNIPFAEEGVMNERELAFEMARHEFWVSMFKLGIVALGLILLVFFVIQPILKYIFPGRVQKEGLIEGMEREEAERVPSQQAGSPPPSELTPKPSYYDRILKASGENSAVIAQALEVLAKPKEPLANEAP
jgi:flagellar M-ring protein FliF